MMYQQEEKESYLRFISSRSRVMSPVIIGSMSLMRERDRKKTKRTASWDQNFYEAHIFKDEN